MWTHDKFEELNLANDEPPRHQDTGKGGRGGKGGGKGGKGGKRKNRKNRQQWSDNQYEEQYDNPRYDIDGMTIPEPLPSNTHHNTHYNTPLENHGAGDGNQGGNPGDMAVYQSGPDGPVLVSSGAPMQLADSFANMAFAPQDPMQVAGPQGGDGGSQQWSAGNTGHYSGHYSTMPMMMMR